MLLNAISAIFQLYHGENKLIFNDMMMKSALYVLDQHAELDVYSASSLTQQSVGRYIAPLGHIILIPSQPVFALSPLCCVRSGETTNINFIVFGLTRSWLEPTIYRTRSEHANYYAADVVCFLTFPKLHTYGSIENTGTFSWMWGLVRMLIFQFWVVLH